MTDELSGEDADNGKEKTRKLTDSEFAEITELYELGKGGISDLAAQFKVSRQALHKRIKDAGLKRGSRAHEAAATVNKAASGAPSASAARIIERFADKRSEWIEETKVSGYQQLRVANQLAQRIISENMKLTPPRPMAALDDDLKAAARFSKLIAENLAARLNLLGADEHIDEQDLPSLTVEDLTEEDILEHFKSINAIEEDATIEDLRDARAIEEDDED